MIYNITIIKNELKISQRFVINFYVESNFFNLQLHIQYFNLSLKTIKNIKI